MLRVRTLFVFVACAFLKISGLPRGQIRFAPAVFLTTGPNCAYAEADDSDGDGDIDVIVKRFHSISLLRNTVTGFASRVSFFVSPLTVTRVARGDFDGDGD